MAAKKMPMKKMTMKQFEKSSMDRKMDTRLKEGSKADVRADRKALSKVNKGRK